MLNELTPTGLAGKESSMNKRRRFFFLICLICLPPEFISAQDLQNTDNNLNEIFSASEADGVALDQIEAKDDSLDAQSVSSKNLLPWRFAWDVKFIGILKTVGTELDFNPLLLYSDRMLNRNEAKMTFTLLPTDWYSFSAYIFFQLHIRNTWSESKETGDLMFRNRFGGGMSHEFSFAQHMKTVLGLEYRLDQSMKNGDISYRHRLAAIFSLKGGGLPGLTWSVEQRVIPFFTKSDQGFSFLETESLAAVEYKLSEKGNVRLYNDFYFDASSLLNKKEDEFYLEETIGVKTGLQNKVDFMFGPTYFFHNLTPFDNVSLFGFKSGLDAIFPLKNNRSDRKWKIGVQYWGAFNFNDKTWDSLFQLSVGYSGNMKFNET